MPARVLPKRPVRVFLKEWREKQGFSQEEVGRKLRKPVDKGTVSRWETSMRGLSLNTLAAYAEAIGVPTAALFRHPSQAESIDELVADSSPEMQRRVRAAVSALVKGDS